MNYYLEINKLLKSIQTIDGNHCPKCNSRLHYDNQNDSVYVSCLNDNTHFEIAGFKDLESGKLVLLYDNNTDGIVNKTILKEFQDVIFRKLYTGRKD